MTSAEPGHVNDMQRYLIEEEAEKWQEGRISRREFVRRATLILGSAAVAGPVLLALGCNPNTPELIPSASTTSQGSTLQPSPQETATAGASTATVAATAARTASATAGNAGGSPFHVPEDDPNVHAEMVEFRAAAGSTMLKAYLALPTPVNARIMTPPGVLVIHENRGLTEHIKDVTRRTGQVSALEEALKEAGVTYEIKIYEGAEHAFHNDTGARYNPEAAKDAWEQTLAWFEKHLRGA